MADFKQTIDNCRIVAFDYYLDKENKKRYSLGVLQGREHCEMISCSDDLGQAFNGDEMFDRPCRIGIRNMNTKTGGSWTVITDIDFIKQANK